MKLKLEVFRPTLALLSAIFVLMLTGVPKSSVAAGPPNPCPGCPPCTNCPPFTNLNERPYSVPGLKLTIPILTNGNMLTTVFESDIF